MISSCMLLHNQVPGMLINKTLKTVSFLPLPDDCFAPSVSGCRQERVNSRKWQTLIKLNEWQREQIFVPLSALMQSLQAGSQLWFEMRGRKEFYLKSGKPQEVTLKSSCHCIPANRQTIHQPTHVCSRAREKHKLPQTVLICTIRGLSFLHLDNQVW